jgi:hypothetical protein
LGTPVQFAEVIQKDFALWKKTIETSGIKGE